MHVNGNGRKKKSNLADAINEISEEETRGADEELLPDGPLRQRNPEQRSSLLFSLHLSLSLFLCSNPKQIKRGRKGFVLLSFHVWKAKKRERERDLEIWNGRYWRTSLRFCWDFIGNRRERDLESLPRWTGSHFAVKTTMQAAGTHKGL